MQYITMHIRYGLRRTLVLAALVSVIAGGAMAIHTSDATAMSMPAWAAEFDAAGDAFDGGGGGGGGGGTLPLVGSGVTICRLNGVAFSCPYRDYRSPIGTVIRKCFWEEFGVIKHSIPCA